ncbi:MAG: ATP-binding cassette domain-containing protein, partial [Chlamydiota bacterium]|nr:ATP-binding cassette domain-containing protein [Chlamydiota bacterium]
MVNDDNILEGIDMDSVLLEADQVCKSYYMGSHELKVLRGIQLKIVKGTFSLILGPSGGGKSTLLHLLGALDKPTGGALRWKGKDLVRSSERELAN